MVSAAREFLTLRAAERRVRSYSPAQHALVKANFEAAERRLLSGRRLTQAVPASILLRDAVMHYLLAIEAVRDAGADEAALGERDLVAALPALPADPLRPRARPTDDERVRTALATGDPLYFDRLAQEDVERARWALDRAASMLRRRVEARSLANVRGTRWGRLVAIGVVVAYASIVEIHAAVTPKNIALGKPVHSSSLHFMNVDGHELVDGRIGTSFGGATLVEDSPNFVIDLQDTYALDRVNVRNRVDGWFDNNIPLVVEVALDGVHYVELARREQHFEATPPWAVAAHGQPARYVRVRLAQRGDLALSEVEVFGRKVQ